MPNVLIVDDDTDIAELSKLLLEGDGYEVRLAANGEEGFLQVTKRLPDVLILDIEMPVLDGPGMAYRMFVNDNGMEEIPIVLSSGALSVSETAENLGTPYFLCKPYGHDALARMTERALLEGIAPKPRGCAVQP